MKPGDVVGVPEIARRLKRTPGEVHRWHRWGELPPPRWTVNDGPAWKWRDIAIWALGTDRPLPAIPGARRALPMERSA